MRPTILLLLLSGLPLSTVAAQTNPFIFFPQDPERQTITSASYVGRPDWNFQAEGFQELGTGWFRGIGDQTGACFTTGFYHWAADEDLSTSETYGIILRSADSTGAIDPNPTGEIVRVAGLTTPTNAAGGRGSWIMIDSFATPVAIPCDQTWFMGVDVPANSAWPATDGHALWRADIPGISPATTGENPRAGAPPANWTVRPGGGTFSNGWTYLIGVLVDAPNLHVGGLDPGNSRQGTGLPNTQPNIALNGLFPDISGGPRSDGITLRVHDNRTPQGLTFLGGALGFGPAIPLPGLAGQLHIDILTTTVLGFGSLNNGAFDFQVLAPGTIAPSLTGITLAFQAVVLDTVTGAARFTNGQTTNL